MSTSRQASSEPEPPNVTSVKSRTSRPRLTVIWRSALAWFHAEISSTPVAHASKSRPSSPARSRMPWLGQVDVERDLAAEQVRRDPAEQQHARR